MKYNLAVDCGGTKVAGILYDDQYRPVKACQVGSIRTTSMPPEYIEKNIREFVSSMALDGMTIGHFSGVLCSSRLIQALQETCTIEHTEHLGETPVGLAACGLREGYLAVAGTGATLGCLWKEKSYAVGGYGAVVFDGGSGYWIAREAMTAAIGDTDQWGPKTLLTELIAKKFGHPREEFRQAIYSIYDRKGIPPITSITACAPLVSEAAAQGDQIAYDILLRAARLLAAQTASLRKLHHLPADLPVAVSGGVWKGHPVIFEEYCRSLQEAGFTGPFLLPEVDPVVGVILFQYLKNHETLSDGDRAHFRQLYKDYLFTQRR